MKLSRGCLYQHSFTDYDSFFLDLDKIREHNDELKIELITRLPPRRLIEQIQMENFESFWLTRTNGENTIIPSLEAIDDFISQSNGDDKCIIIEGFEMIYDSAKPRDSMIFLLETIDKIRPSNICIILSLNPLCFDASWYVKVKPNLKSIDFSESKMEYIEESPTNTDIEFASKEIDIEIGVDGSPKLALLSRLPKVGFNKDILVKRILQWRRMGLDVSEIEPALNYEDDRSYELYRIVEEKTRRAVELEQFINENKHQLSASEISVDLFRIRQLSGLDELERKYYSNS